MLRNEDKYNDKAGIIFLLLLIGTVFIADFLIEISKSIKTVNTQNYIEYKYTMPGYSPEPVLFFLTDECILRYKYEENAYNSFGVNTKLEFSIIFFLFISFVFSVKNFDFEPHKLIISFLYFISFIFNEFSNTALPRPPPQRIA